MDKTVFFIGGSPCSGKSTIAEHLAAQFDLFYFKIDDYLDRYLAKACADGYDSAQKMAAMTCDEMWLRDPEVLLEDEIVYYRNVFQYILADIQSLNTEKHVISEGAAILPELADKLKVPKNRYLCIVPTPSFQNEKYAERSWIEYILAESSDKQKAFSNWMKRDELFGVYVLDQAKTLGYKTIVTSDQTPLEENIEKVKIQFDLK